MKLLTGKIFSVFYIILFIFLLSVPPAFAATLPSGFTETNVVTGLSSPVGMAFLPDGRILVIEQAGAIKLVSSGTASTLLTVTGITTGGERGLLGIAVDPDYPTRPYIYVYYTAATSPNYAQVARYTFSNNTIDPNSKLILINDIPDNASNHNGGTLRFGLDKTLYISVGDDASSCDAQNRTLLKGNILRIKVDDTINPADRATLAPVNNPFVSATNNNEKIVFAYGLRNPFRFNIHPDTGALFIGDVGQSTREEVDISIGGENFGWPYWEGNVTGPNTGCGGGSGTMPIYDYTRGASASVIGGVVYKGVNYPNDASLPAEFNGNFFFNDYYTGNLRVLRWNGSIWNLVAGVDSTNFGTGYSYVSDWTVGPDGAIYYVNQGGSRIVRIAYSQGPAILTASLPNGTVSVTYNQTITATGGTQPYTWSVSSGSLPNGLTLNLSTGNISGTPTAQGTSTFTIQVTDANSQTNSRQFSIIINPQPVSLTIITSSLPSGTIGYSYNTTLQATGLNTVLPYTWALQSGALPTGLTLSNSGNDSVISGTPTQSGSFNLTIRVQDSASNSATRDFTLTINKVQITTTSLSDATVGAAYYIDLSAGAANLPAQAIWEVVQGSLPPGLDLESIGHFEGTPTQAGTYAFTIRVSETGNSLNTDSQAYTLNVNSVSVNSNSGSGGDSSAGGGCGFVKDDGKGPRAKGEGLALMIMLIIVLLWIALIRRMFTIRIIQMIAVLLFSLAVGCGGGSAPADSIPADSVPAGDSGRVQSIEFITYGGAPVYSTALNKIAFHRFDPTIIGGPDLSGNNDNTGTFELWIADPDGSNEGCISCGDVAGGPRRNQHKGAPTWHASGQWIVVAVEMPVHAAPHARAHAGLGAYLDLWAISPDGAQWYQLTYYANIVTTPRFSDTPAGALIPRFSRSGNKLVWAEMIGYDAQHPFAIWRLVLADFIVDATGPHLINHTRFEPGTLGTTFYEAWSFSPDDNYITVASESGGIHPGYMDVQIWNPNAGTLVNLTQTNDQYEEQAVFSPDGQWIAFMSTHGQSPPYDPSNDFWGTFRTDVWLMRADGTSSERLSYFSDPAHAEYLPGAVNRAVPVSWSPDGKSIYVNVDQNHGSQQTHETQRIYRINLR